MLKLDSLKRAADRAVQKVKQVNSEGRSSYNDIANNIASILFSSSRSFSRTVDNEDNRKYFRDYFRALNDYLVLINNNEIVSQKERLGDVFAKPPRCAMPIIRDMNDDEAKILGYRNAKIAYIGSLKAIYS